MEKKMKRRRKSKFDGFLELVLVAAGCGCLAGVFVLFFYTVISVIL